MEKPFVVCHMFVSMDGKIDGSFMSHPNAVPARTEYGKLRGFYQCDAILYGTVTMAGGFADGWEPHVPHSPTRYPREDWLAPSEVKNYIISIDPKGELAWSSPYIEKKGRPKAHAVEVLTGQVSDDYLSYLRGYGVSYLFAGEEQLDCALLLHKLKTRLGIDRLMLAGGGYVNGSFLAAGLIDEVSLVVAPVADGNTESVSSFERFDFLQNQAPAVFSLAEVRRLDGDGIWLRYQPK